MTRRPEAALEEIRGEGWRDEVEQLDSAEAPGALPRLVRNAVEPLLSDPAADDHTQIGLSLSISATSRRL